MSVMVELRRVPTRRKVRGSKGKEGIEKTASEDTATTGKRKSVMMARTIGAGMTMMLVDLTIEMKVPGITIEMVVRGEIGSAGIAVKQT